jgi:hypothetical protein
MTLAEKLLADRDGRAFMDYGLLALCTATQGLLRSAIRRFRTTGCEANGAHSDVLGARVL